MAYHLLQRDRTGAQGLANALNGALQRVGHCQLCNTFSESTICPLCASNTRDKNLLCVVEMPTDLMMLELMGRLSPLDGIGPKEINLDKLIKRAQDGVVNEVILATNYTNEGEATAHYISELLKSRGVAVSRIARGLPMGGEIEYVDSGTLSMALLGRKSC